MSVTDYKHPDYIAAAPLWRKVRAACAGEDAIKAAGERYLPDPGDDPADPKARRRYERYLERAVYFNATGRTLRGLVGVAFANWPRMVVPEDYILDDVDGSGISLVNQAQLVLSDVLQTGRGGLLADCSSVDPTKKIRGLTQSEAEAAGWRLRLSYWPAERILTWELQGQKLTRLVLESAHHEYIGGELNVVPELLELVLVNGKCVFNRHRKYTDNGKYILASSITSTHTSIPFHFIGATNNDPHPDTPPLLDLANLNIAHFRNSADHEESVFLMGQPMLAITGVTDEWVDKRGEVHIGSRAALALPQGGDAKFIQPQPNTLAKEAMPGDVVILAGEKEAQAMEVWEKAFEAHAILSELGDLPPVKRSNNVLKFGNGSRVLALPSTVDSIRGYSAKLVLIDEAAFTGDDVLGKVTPMLSATGGRLVCPSTPNGDRGWWRDAWKSGDPAWTRLTVSIDKLPRLTPAEIERQKSILTPNQFRQEFLLEFLDTDLQFYSTETIEAALCDEIVPLFERSALEEAA